MAFISIPHQIGYMGEHTCKCYPDKDSPACTLWVESEHDLSPVNERKLLHTARTLKVTTQSCDTNSTEESTYITPRTVAPYRYEVYVVSDYQYSTDCVWVKMSYPHQPCSPPG